MVAGVAARCGLQPGFVVHHQPVLGARGEFTVDRGGRARVVRQHTEPAQFAGGGLPPAPGDDRTRGAELHVEDTARPFRREARVLLVGALIG